MANWSQFSEADFDSRRAPRRALNRAAADAAAGQDGLFFVATPVQAAKAAPEPEQLPGQADLFGDGGQGVSEPESSETGHAPDPDPEQGAFDVCRKCGQPIVQHWATGQWVTMTGTANAECYGRRS